MRVDLTYDHHHTFRCRGCKKQFTINRELPDQFCVVRCTHCDSPDTYQYQTLFKRVRNYLMLYEMA